MISLGYRQIGPPGPSLLGSPGAVAAGSPGPWVLTARERSFPGKSGNPPPDGNRADCKGEQEADKKMNANAVGATMGRQRLFLSKLARSRPVGCWAYVRACDTTFAIHQGVRLEHCDTYSYG